MDKKDEMIEQLQEMLAIIAVKHHNGRLEFNFDKDLPLIENCESTFGEGIKPGTMVLLVTQVARPS